MVRYLFLSKEGSAENHSSELTLFFNYNQSLSFIGGFELHQG